MPVSCILNTHAPALNPTDPALAAKATDRAAVPAEGLKPSVRRTLRQAKGGYSSGAVAKPETADSTVHILEPIRLQNRDDSVHVLEIITGGCAWCEKDRIVPRAPPFAWRKVRRTEGLSPSAGTAARSVALAASAGSVRFKAGA